MLSTNNCKSVLKLLRFRPSTRQDWKDGTVVESSGCTQSQQRKYVKWQDFLPNHRKLSSVYVAAREETSDQIRSRRRRHRHGVLLSD